MKSQTYYYIPNKCVIFHILNLKLNLVGGHMLATFVLFKCDLRSVLTHLYMCCYSELYFSLKFSI